MFHRWRALTLPTVESKTLEIEECLEAADVVFDHREILILNGAAHLQNKITLSGRLKIVPLCRPETSN